MKTRVVFGGSGRLGERVVRRLAEAGPLRFSYFGNERRAEELASALRREGRDVAAARIDIRDPAAVAQFLEEASKPDGLASVISANGAPFPVCPLYEVETADFRRIVDIDICGTFHLMKSATPLLAAGGGGSIVIFLTAAILRTARLDGMSSIPKTALMGMIRQLARDAGPLNVRVNGIAPGVVHTDKVADIAALPHYTRTMVESFIADTPIPRLINPDGIAALAEFLVSDAAADISGQIIGADGGYSA